MKRRRKRHNLLGWGEEESINLTPLLDMIFNLIFFFILATTLRQSKALLEVRLPSVAKAIQETMPKKSLVITVTKEDKIFLGEREMTLESLDADLKNIPPQELGKLIIQGDAQAHHEAIVKVLDACARAGHRGVSVEVKRPGY